MNPLQIAGMAMALVCSVSVQAQMVQVMPTNYIQVVTAQNNLGRIFRSWVTDVQETTVLAERTLTMTRTVYFRSAYYMGSKFGAPKQLEENYVYRQIGATTYLLQRAERIIYWAPKVAGGWVAHTNNLVVEHNETLQWSPGAIGTTTIGNAYSRTVITASPLDCHCRNLSSQPHVLTFRCANQAGQSFDYKFDFLGGQSKLVTLQPNELLNSSEVDFFTFDLDETHAEPR